jgi:hypothetical protein
VRYWWLREVAAVTQAWLDLNLLHPTPVLGKRLPLPETVSYQPSAFSFKDLVEEAILIQVLLP